MAGGVRRREEPGLLSRHVFDILSGHWVRRLHWAAFGLARGMVATRSTKEKSEDAHNGGGSTALVGSVCSGAHRGDIWLAPRTNPYPGRRERKAYAAFPAPHQLRIESEGRGHKRRQQLYPYIYLLLLIHSALRASTKHIRRPGRVCGPGGHGRGFWLRPRRPWKSLVGASTGLTLGEVASGRRYPLSLR